MGFLHEAVIFLVAAVVAVTVFKRTGLGSVLGYLVAGAVIGPSMLKLVADVESVMRISELGVVLLLFIIGLELQPSRLWAMRGHVFGIGGLQVVATTAVLWGLALTLGIAPAEALLVGFSLSLSSTALAVQVLSERHQLTQAHGRTAFGILLFQDLAAIPFLALVPLLGSGTHASHGSFGMGALKVAATLLVLVMLSRVVLRPLLKVVAGLHSQEVFTSTTLLVVAGTAVAMEAIGLSATLGAFLAGVLLADSEYRHELEADIEPFKGLLLGLFFMAVGMSVRLDVLVAKPLHVVAQVVGLMALKGLVLFAIGKWKLKSTLGSLRLALSVSQGGEFAFVVFGLATASSVLSADHAAQLVLVVGLSLAVTPIATAIFEKWVAPRLTKTSTTKPFDVIVSDGEPPVVIAGFGRVGQVVGRVLLAKHIPFIALDASSEHVDFVRRFGNKVFYGDASRLELLESAGAGKARVMVVAVDDVQASMRVVETVQRHFPHLALVVRARNRQHAYELLAVGVTHFVRETLGSSVELTGQVLRELGMAPRDVQQALERFRAHDEKLLADSFTHRADLPKLQATAKQAFAELERLFDADATR